MNNDFTLVSWNIHVLEDEQLQYSLFNVPYTIAFLLCICVRVLCARAIVRACYKCVSNCVFESSE